MHNNKIAAVDFGSKKFSISLGEINDSNIDVLGYLSLESKGIEKGLIRDEVKCSESFLNLMVNFEEKMKQSVNEVYVGISSRDIRLLEVMSEISLNYGKVTVKDINRAIDKGRKNINIDDSEEIVDCIINFYVLDDNPIFDTVIGWSGEKLKVNITYFVGKKSEIDKFRKVIKNSGRELKGFIINIYSGRQVFFDEDNSNGIRVLIDVGAGVSDYAVFKEGILKETGSIPLGGNNITNDLAICGEYDKNEAEKMKIISSNNYISLYENNDEEDMIKIESVDVSKTLLYEVTNARLEEILKLVNSKLKNSSYYEGICSIILYGDGMAYYENINKLLHKEFNNEVKAITKEYLGMKNSLNITSLAIVKEVSDRLDLLSRDTKTEKEIEYLLNEKEETEQPKVKENNSIVHKIKKVLGEIF